MLINAFRRSPQACIMQLGLSPEHPDPCSSTALELASGMDTPIVEPSPWSSIHLGKKARAHTELSVAFGASIGMPCMVRDGNVLPEAPVVLKLVSQARQAMSPPKLDGSLHKTQKTSFRGTPCEVWCRSAHIFHSYRLQPHHYLGV